MDGKPAFVLWDLVFEVLHSSLNQTSTQRNLCRNDKSGKHSKVKNYGNTPTREDLRLTNVDHVTSNAKRSHFGALLYFVEDNKASDQDDSQGRSPTMRHVSRTHGVALDRLFGQNRFWTQKTKIKYVGAKKPTWRPDERQFHSWWMEPPSPFVQCHGHLKAFIWPFQLNQLSSDHVKKAGTGWKTRRRRTSGCKIKNQCWTWYRSLSIGLPQRWFRAHLKAGGYLQQQIQVRI